MFKSNTLLAIFASVCYAKIMKKELTMTEMLKAGVHFGHTRSKWNPSMQPYVYTLRNNVHIIDLEQTVDKLKKAQKFIQELVFDNGIILFIGTRRQAKKLVKQAAEEVKMPYVVERWLGGTFTNFKVISKQIAKLRDLEAKQESGELKKYTKKEQHEIQQEINRLNKLIGGIKMVNKLPDAIFVLDAHHDALAIKEANTTGIKVVALVDTNTDPTQVQYPIPSNDDAVKVIKLILEQIVYAIKKGQKKRNS